MGDEQLHAAVKTNDSDRVTSLLTAKSSVDGLDARGFTPLYYAARRLNLAVCDVLLSNGANPSAPVGKQKSTVLHEATATGCVELVASCLKAKGDINSCTAHNWTPLHFAAYHGHVAAAKVLLEAKASLTAKTADGEDVSQLARDSKRDDILELLKQMDVQDEEPLHQQLQDAVKCGDSEEVQELLSRGADPNIADAGTAPLLIASRRAFKEVCLILLRAKADPAVKSISGLSPLHFAAQADVVDVINALLEHAANVNVRDPGFWTPLHHAARSGSMRALESLLAASADVLATDNEDCSPADVARASMQTEVVKRLQVVGNASEPLISRTTNNSARSEELNWTSDIDPLELDILDRLGAGAYATVYKGEFRGCRVAIKEMGAVTDRDRELFKRELYLLERLHHPNIVLFMGACLGTTPLRLVFELCDQSLDHYLWGSKQFTWEHRLGIAADVACALAFLAAAQPPVVHRDVKSPNVLLRGTAPPVGKLADFGLARTMLQGSNAMMSKQAGSTQWMAPEVMLGEEYDHTCDIYSLGIVMWELAARNIPYEGLPQPLITMRVVKDQMRPSFDDHHSPEGFAKLAQECWAQSASERPSARDVMVSLRKLARAEHIAKLRATAAGEA
mmetsp:Transcript_81782/g.187127  ORF Transcript_81782/g.187127 Transcript_81782/m.187127 type:complete len:623 (+) Transcript_81782:42-1910(+)